MAWWVDTSPLESCDSGSSSLLFRWYLGSSHIASLSRMVHSASYSFVAVSPASCGSLYKQIILLAGSLLSKPRFCNSFRCLLRDKYRTWLVQRVNQGLLPIAYLLVNQRWKSIACRADRDPSIVTHIHRNLIALILVALLVVVPRRVSRRYWLCLEVLMLIMLLVPVINRWAVKLTMLLWD